MFLMECHEKLAYRRRANRARKEHLFHISKIKVSLCEVLAQRNVQGDLCVVVVVAQVQVFIHVVFNDKGLVAVQTASAAVRVQHGRERTQVALAEGRDEALVEAQFVQEDLDQGETGNENISII